MTEYKIVKLDVKPEVILGYIENCQHAINDSMIKLDMMGGLYKDLDNISMEMRLFTMKSLEEYGCWMDLNRTFNSYLDSIQNNLTGDKLVEEDEIKGIPIQIDISELDIVVGGLVFKEENKTPYLGDILKIGKVVPA